jgi:hypothetical protein
LLSAGGSEFFVVFANSYDAMIVSPIDFGHDDFCFFVLVVSFVLFIANWIASKRKILKLRLHSAMQCYFASWIYPSTSL